MSTAVHGIGETSDRPHRMADNRMAMFYAGGERIEWAALMVMTLITGIPPVILYMLAQRHLSKTFAAAT